MKKFIVLLALGASLSVSAQEQELEEVVIRAHPLADEGLSQDVEVLSGAELVESMAETLGETVSKLPGVRSANFGSAAGRPVIHGLGGPRVKTTQDQIDTLDVSVTSTDHAVTVDPIIAEQITVLKGASTLLYGSGAIGGVVDVETGRLPNKLPAEPFSGVAEVRFADNADAKSGAISLNGQAGESIAWHLDAFSRDADEYDIPVGAESIAQLLEEGEDLDEANESGELEGSFYEIEGGSIGLSFVGERGFFGASISTTKADYGLVGGHGHEEGHDEDGEEHHDEDEDHHDEDEHEGEEHDEEGHEEEEEGVGVIDLEQTRFDIEGQLNDPFAGFESLNVRVGFSDYEHSEIEGSGEIGTLFDNDAWEGRVLAKHNPVNGFDGSLGFQLGSRDFSALGEEAFVPPVETDTFAVFWVGERATESGSLELGLRYENTDHTPSTGADRSFDSVSASVGYLYDMSESSTISALLDYTERAPAPEELFANGPHLATNSFEIGDPNLEQEKGLSISFGWKYDTENLDARVSAYYVDFENFIYEIDTGLEEDELPVLQYVQQDAEFSGIDFELAWHLAEFAGGDLDLILEGDVVSTTLAGGDELPRIPANRKGVTLAWANDDWRAKLSFRDTSAQNDNASFELPTQGYDDLSFNLSRNFDLDIGNVVVFLNGRNLTDEEQRDHVSFVKDFVPAPGRRIEAGVRLSF